jgi:uncharacterized surface protein with fasciclin (FAS1) repeats
MNDEAPIFSGESGGMEKVTIPIVFQSNGVIHVIDTMLLPY